MLGRREIQCGGRFQCLSHLLQQQQLGEARIEPTGDARVALPVQPGECRAGPLSRPQAIERLASPIAKRLALRMDTASKIALQELAGLATQLVVTELV